MKFISLKNILAVSLLLCSVGFAQHPQIGPLNGIQYQAIAIDERGKEIVGTDVNGKPLFNKTIAVRFTIRKGSDGDIEYQETHTVQTDRYGMFSLVIGKGTSSEEGSADSLLDIPWIDADQWLGVEISSHNDGTFRLVSNQALMSVPYAFYADDVADDAITTWKILDQNVQTDDLQDSAVTSQKILDQTIQTEDLHDSAVVLTSKVQGILRVRNGGTGAASLDSNNLLLGNGTGAVKVLGSATDGQIPIGSTGAAPVLANLIAGQGMAITNGPGTITLSSTIVGGVQSNGNTTVNPGNIASMTAWTSPAFPLPQPADLDPIAMGDILLGSVDVDLQGCIFHIYLESVNAGTAHARVTIFNPGASNVNLGNGVNVKILVVQ